MFSYFIGLSPDAVDIECYKFQRPMNYSRHYVSVEKYSLNDNLLHHSEGNEHVVHCITIYNLFLHSLT
jgi:hypothetical protein